MTIATKYKPYPKYKPSGIDWLGDIPEGWGISRLNNPNFFQIQKSGINMFLGEKGYLSTKSINNSDVAKAGELMTFKERPSRANLQPKEDSVYFAKMKATLKFLLPNRDFCKKYILSTGFAGINLINIEPKYIFYIISSYGFNSEKDSWSFGSTQEAINENRLKNIFIPIPPRNRQQSIAEFLDRETVKVDEVVEKKQRLIKLLEEKRQAIIAQAVTKGLDLDVEMKESKLGWIGEIPKNWRVMKLKYLVKEKKDAIKTGPFGSDLKRSDYVYAKEIAFAKVYTQKNVIESNLNLGDDYVSKEKCQELIACKLEVGDVVMTTRGTLGKSIIFTDEAELGILHPCLLRVQLDGKQLLKEFFQVLIQESYYFNEQLLYISNATTIEVLYGDALKPMIITLPNLKEQKEIIQYIDYKTLRINSLVEKIKNQNKKLEEYRQALISNAVTGKIKVN